MSPDSPPPNPSRTVEKIREIIVGRQLDRLEQRIARLETGGAHAAGRPQVPPDDLFPHAEARMEALRQGLERHVETTRQEAEIRHQQIRAEVQRLAAQIQQVAAARAAESEGSAVRQLEGRLGQWLGQWQGALQNHLAEREQRLADQLRGEVAGMWEHTEQQITRLQSRSADRQWLEQRLARVAAAARALAEAASPPDNEFVPPR
jgi:hypothetical protein